MRKDSIKKALFFGVGSLFGAGVLYALLNRDLERKYEDILDYELAAMKKYYKKRESDLVDGLASQLPPPEGAETEQEESDPEDERLALKTELNRNQYWNPSTDEGTEKVVKVTKTVEVQTETVNTPPRPEEGPYVITLEEFMYDHQEYEKSSIVYYEDDDSLVDEREELIDDIVKVIGPDALNFFGWESGSDDIVHVRNPNLSMDFEIARDLRGYSEAVLGIPPLPVGDVSDDG